MARYKRYSYDQAKLIPVDLASQLQPGTFEFALHQIIDDLDLSSFAVRFRNDATGAPAYDPAVLLKIVLLGYSRGMLSSRELERACQENVVFMAISADSRPHFTTIARFISGMSDAITPLFRNVLLVCADEGLIGRQLFAIDGCKLSANCAKEWSGTRLDFEKRAAKLDEAIRQLLARHREADDAEVAPHARDDTQAAIRRLRRKRRKVERWLAGMKDRPGTRGPRQQNVTDPESAKMPSAHGVIQGYSGVAAVDSKCQVVVHAEAFGEGQEQSLLGPMLKGVRDNGATMGDKAVLKTAVVVADNGFHSEANMRMLLDDGIDAYLPDRQFRKRDPAFAGARRYRRSVDRKKQRYVSRGYFQPKDFRYDEVRRRLVCPAGQLLYRKNRNFVSSNGYRGEAFMARRTDCAACGLRERCLRKRHTPARQVVLFRDQDATGARTASARMRERFDTARGRYYYSRRMGIVEPVFAHLRHTRHLDRFTLRGRARVDIQWKLYCVVHNMMKLMRFSPRFA